MFAFGSPVDGGGGGAADKWVPQMVQTVGWSIHGSLHVSHQLLVLLLLLLVMILNIVVATDFVWFASDKE